MKPLALIVEDQQAIAIIWSRSLEKIGMEVKWAACMKDALLMCNEIPPPDLILLDLRLGDSKDIETLDQIKSLKQSNPNAVVMVISGFLTPELTKLAMEKGAHAAREKMDMNSSKALWGEIDKAAQRAPENAQAALAYTRNIIKQLVETLHLL